MATVVRFIGDGQTTVTDINNNLIVLRRKEIATLADATWSGYSAQYQSLFEQIGSGSSGVSGGVAAHSALIGNGSATVFTIAHGLNKAGVTWSVLDVSVGDYVFPTVTFVDVNTLRITFGIAPTINQYRVAVTG